MVLELKKTQKEEIDYLTKLENTSFEVNAKYFENGVFPPLPEEDEKKYSFRALYEKNDTEALTIFYEGEIAGSVIVKDIKPETKEILCSISINAVIQLYEWMNGIRIKNVECLFLKRNVKA